MRLMSETKDSYIARGMGDPDMISQYPGEEDRMGACDVVYSTGGAHHECTRCDPDGISDTGGSGWRWCCRWFITGVALSFTELGPIKAGRLPDCKNISHGVLVIRRLVDLRLSIFIPRRS